MRRYEFDSTKGRKETALSDAIDKFLKSEGLLEVSREKLCPLIWAEVVGTWYGNFTRVTRVRDGIVYIRCDSAPRANQLQLDAPQIVKNLNERLGGNYIQELRPSSTGTASTTLSVAANQQPDAPTDEQLQAIELEPDAINHIRDTANEVDDEDLREQLQRVLVTQARLRIWQAQHGYTRCAKCGGYYPGKRETCIACDPPIAPSQAGGELGLSKYGKDGGGAGKADGNSTG